MIIMFFAALIGVLMLNIFSLTISIQGLNRAIIYTPIEIFYADTNLDGIKPILDKNKIIEHLDSYYDKSLLKYCSSYEATYYFYNQNDGSMCLEDFCNAVEVDIKIDLTFSYQYHRVMYYELRSNNG